MRLSSLTIQMRKRIATLAQHSCLICIYSSFNVFFVEATTCSYCFIFFFKVQSIFLFLQGTIFLVAFFFFKLQYSFVNNLLKVAFVVVACLLFKVHLFVLLQASQCYNVE